MIRRGSGCLQSYFEIKSVYYVSSSMIVFCCFKGKQVVMGMKVAYKTKLTKLVLSEAQVVFHEKIRTGASFLRTFQAFNLQLS